MTRGGKSMTGGGNALSVQNKSAQNKKTTQKKVADWQPFLYNFFILSYT
jgi:hypothetical protein